MKKLLVLLLIIGGFTFFWYKEGLKPADVYNQTRHVIEIPKGLSNEDIAELLEEKGIIKSSLVFRLYTKFNGLETKLQAGTFVLNSALELKDIVATLTTGTGQESILTIPEGFTVKDIDELLTEKGLITAGQLIDCANRCDFSEFDFLPNQAFLAERGGRIEGYLFPDTYFITESNFTVKSFLDRLLSTFNTRVIEGLAEEIEEFDIPLHDIVTMASLVEEETRTAEERPVVSGIIWKRQNAGMRLDIDAAVRYILNKPTDAITVTDLAVDSPYNLRKVGGLPPGPIANPGLSSIRATLNPESSPYWFYLHGSDGQIHYGKTNDEHNRNKRFL